MFLGTRLFWRITISASTSRCEVTLSFTPQRIIFYVLTKITSFTAEVANFFSVCACAVQRSGAPRRNPRLASRAQRRPGEGKQPCRGCCTEDSEAGHRPCFVRKRGALLVKTAGEDGLLLLTRFPVFNTPTQQQHTSVELLPNSHRLPFFFSNFPPPPGLP